MTHDERMGSMPIKKLLIQLSIPTITAQLINALYNIVDRVYIGHIEGVGGTALTSLGVCFPLLMLISATSVLISAGGAARAAISMGRGDRDSAEKILGNATSALLLISATLFVIFLFWREPLLYLFGASDVTYPFADSYFSVYLFGTAFVQISLGLNTFITTQGFTNVSMRTVLIGAICNIILDPIFIFGLDMGVAGAALATIISQGISALWVLRFLTGKKTILKIRRKHLRIDPKVLMPCVALGFAPFIMQSTESLIMLCFNNSLLKYGGDVAVGAMTVLSSAMQMVMMPLQGLTQGAQPIMSYNYGARKADRVREAFRFLLTCCLVYSAAAWVVCMSIPRAIGGVFTDSEAIIDVVGWALRVYMGGTVIFGAQIACQQTFVALGNAKTSAFLAIFRKIIVLVPLIFILPPFFPAEAKTFAVWLAEPIADVAAVTMTTTLFRRQFKTAMEQLTTV